MTRLQRRRARWATWPLLVVAFDISACSQPAEAPSSDPATYAATLESGVNDARAAEGLPELTHSDCAVAAAAARAADLVGNPDLPHAPMDAVLAECGVGVAGENLSRATLPADAVVDAWLGSPGHRSNILDAQYTASGVACVPDGEEQRGDRRSGRLMVAGRANRDWSRSARPDLGWSPTVSFEDIVGRMVDADLGALGLAG